MNLTISRVVVAPAMAIISQTTLMYDAGRGVWEETVQRSVTITSQQAPRKQNTKLREKSLKYQVENWKRWLYISVTCVSLSQGCKR